MSAIEILFISLGLAMDCFAVSFVASLSGRIRTVGQSVLLAFLFGLFQGGMPLLGWLGGSAFREVMAPYDHWIAFALLGLIAAHLFYDSYTGEDRETSPTASIHLQGMLLLSLATSIDALAAGLSFAVLSASIYQACLSIGLVAVLMTLVGLTLGRVFRGPLHRWAAALGGMILLGLGIRILIDHIQKGI